jgi:16S rRNA (adenine(1408)-N(1))-methyltransferase
VTLTEVVGKGRTRELTDLAARRGDRAHVFVDVGTGDGRLAYAVASAHPSWLVLGLDALDEPMGETAQKAGRKPAKGGVDNLVLLRASIEHVPEELRGIANEVSVMLPWGRLLEGIVLGASDVVDGIAALTSTGARVCVTLNGEMWASTPAKYAHLPLPTPAYVADVIAPAFATAAIAVGPAAWMSAEDIATIGSTWARRLSHGRAHPKFVRFEGVRQ